ncbi:MAG: M1 family metallopeptidase [Planctomycetota bacterium]|jgi:hypothetical protein
MKLHRSLFLALILAAPLLAHDQHAEEEKGGHNDAFRQLGTMLPTPNRVRTASGAPGPDYWQQRADYVIHVSIDAQTHRLAAKEKVTYHNNSPHPLRYLWMQLDQNRFRHDSIGRLTRTENKLEDGRGTRWMRRIAAQRKTEAGVDIESVTDAAGGKLAHTIVQTMMRIDLPQPLDPGKSIEFHVAWSHNIIECQVVGGRGGYEWFKKTKNAVYGIAQWFPRMCAYTDYEGWQNKQFIGSGEFTLEFGDYEVHISVPDTFVVSATGELENAQEVLTEEQRKRLAESRNAEKPLFVVTPDEAKANEKRKAVGTRTWIYRAKNVRDFAFAASAKFVWDAMGVKIEDRTVMAMSLYPNEAIPLWDRYATHAVAQTLEVYSHHTIPYPYPVAIAVHGPVGGGMEYPMISFNGARPEEDGTYTDRTKRFCIGVIIHETGHNWFPMIINSDERQWTWMDEGLNTFCQYLAEVAWEKRYDPRGGEPKNVTQYMASLNQVPIMTNSELILQFGNNAYRKPATALNVLRESVMGRELFDHAFREYARRWAFKRPTPADLFRTLEDASGIDLDWFWRGWFYSTGHVDIAIDRVEKFTLKTRDPVHDKAHERKLRDAEPRTLTQERSAAEPKRADRYPELADFYSKFDKLDVTQNDKRKYREFMRELEDKDDRPLFGVPWHFYVVRFKNEGGLVSPLPLRITYEDGKAETIRVPAEIWRRSNDAVGRLFITDQPIHRIEFDPSWETADTDRSNNEFPAKVVNRTFELKPRDKKENPMQIAKRGKNRTATRKLASAYGKVLLAEWRKHAPAAPAAVLNTPTAIDPWGKPFQVRFSRAKGDDKELRLAWLHSDGPDGKPETDDDVEFVVYRDGSLKQS